MAKLEDLLVEGLTFTPIVRKDSKFSGWNSKGLSWSEAVKEVDRSGGYYTGLGLVHGTSGTCCLDIDDVNAATEWFKTEHGIDNIMEKLDGHFEVLSPNSKTGKFMFKLPPVMREPDLLMYENKDNWWSHDKVAEIKLEFMAGSRQDAWPGSAYWDKNKEEFTGRYSHRGSNELKDLPMWLFRIWHERQEDKKRRTNTNGSTIESEHSRQEWYDMIRTGENYHDALKTLSLGMIKDQVLPPNECFTILSTLVMASHPSDSDRIGSKQRVMANNWKELRDLIEGAKNHINSNKVEEIEDILHNLNNLDKRERQYREIPWPPGRFGEFCKGIKRSQGVQYNEMAILTGIMSLAAIAGKSFNISDAITSEINVNQSDPNVQRALGGNLFCAILGDSGSGKGEFEKTIEQLIYHGSGLNSNSSFLLHNDFSSGTNIQKDLINAKCGISILDEAGASLLSQSGDPMKRKVVVLDAWAKSGYNRTLLRQKINGEENKIPRIRGAAFSMAMLSSPRKFKQAFYQQGSVDDGMAPRTLILSLTSERGVRNRNVIWDFPDGTLEKFAALQKMGSEIQAKEFHVPHFIWMPDHIREDAYRLDDSYLEEMNELVKLDYNKGIMLNRAYETTLRVADLITVYNKDKEDPGCLRVDEEEWEWAKSFVKYFTDGTDDFFTGAFFGDEMQEAMKIVRYEISRIIDGHEMKEKAANVPIGIAKKGYFTKTSLFRRLKNKNEINVISSKASYNGKYKKGLDKVLDYLIDEGEIKKAGKVYGLKAQNAFQITNLFGGD